MTIYLDNNATTPVIPAAKEAVLKALGCYGNPSSVHAPGREARHMLDHARRAVAQSLDVRAEQVVFTSGGTEANNLALRGIMAAAAPGSRLLASAVEHPSVRNTVQDLGGETIAVDSSGRIRLDLLEAALKQGNVALVAIMHSNNETGVLQPVAQVVELCRAHGVLVHVDAIQSFGKVPLSFESVGADTLSLSFHKLGGPKGVGALIIKGQPAMSSLITGGGHERNRRAGTENLPGIAAAGAAAEHVSERLALMGNVAQLRDRFEQTVGQGLPGVIFVAQGAPRLPNTSNVLFPGVSGEDMVMALDLEGFAVSAGSACSSGRTTPSKTLLAHGYTPQQVAGAIRVSLGPDTTQGDIDAFAQACIKITRRLQDD